jgi:hypothetical protein
MLVVSIKWMSLALGIASSLIYPSLNNLRPAIHPSLQGTVTLARVVGDIGFITPREVIADRIVWTKGGSRLFQERSSLLLGQEFLMRDVNSKLLLMVIVATLFYL